MSTDLLTVDQVTKVYSTGGMLSRVGLITLDKISFSLHTARPEIFAIIGESGSSKTTLAARHSQPARADFRHDHFPRNRFLEDPRATGPA